MIEKNESVVSRSVLTLAILICFSAIIIIAGFLLFFKKPSPTAVQPTASPEIKLSPDEITTTTPELILTTNDFFTYGKNDQISSVSKSEFNVLNNFNALELENKSKDCGTNKSEQYFKQLLSYYSENDNGAEFQFKYLEPSQDSGIWIITVIPNKIGYTKLEDFKNDFDLCEAGSNRYPTLMSDKYLLFVSSCGTGFDDGSGLPHGCDVVREIVEPTIKFNIDIADWKNYQNSKMKFSFKYPADWAISENNILSTGSEIELNKNNDIQLSIKFGVHYSQELGRNYTLQEWIVKNRESIKNYVSKLKEENVILDDALATKFSYENNKNGFITNEIYTEKEGILYEIIASINSTKKSFYNPIFDKIISTFKFIK